MRHNGLVTITDSNCATEATYSRNTNQNAIIIVNDKKLPKRKVLWVLMNHESFLYECFKQWQHFNIDEAKTSKVFYAF